MSLHDVTLLIGGLAIFLHGLALARDGLQVLAGERLRGILFALTENRVMAVIAGILMVLVLQSSTAATVMLIGFTGSQILTLPRSLAMLLGGNVGTTFIPQLVTFDLSGWALVIALLGVVLRMVAKRRRARSAGDSLLGLGFLFYGITMMGEAAAPLAHSPSFLDALALLARQPLVGILAGAVMAVLMQGSAQAIGVFVSFAHGGALPVEAAVPLVLGANIGTTITPLISAVGAGVDGKRVAMAHVLLKAIPALLAVLFIHDLVRLTAATSSDPARQVANVHTLFNVIVAAVALPLVGPLARLLERLFRPKAERRFAARYLDARALESPALAFANAKREFLRMADITGDMLRDALTVLDRGDLDLASDVEGRDDQVDTLNREIRFYLARLGEENMTSHQVRWQLELITVAADVENIGDLINRNLVALARKKVTLGLQFSEEGRRELARFHAAVADFFDLSVAAYSTFDPTLARRAMRERSQLDETEAALRRQHIGRLHLGLRESLDTSSIHLDVLSLLLRIASLASHMAEAVLEGEREEPAEARA